MSKLIVFEAINAAGKTTQFNLLLKKFKKEGYKTDSIHFHQRDRATGQLIENKFLLDKNNNFFKREQALLYIQDFFSRKEDMDNFLSKKDKRVLVLDRYYSSTMAYQSIGLSGQARRKTVDWIAGLCEKGKPVLPKPDMTLLLDVPVDISLGHLKESGEKKDYFESRKKLLAIRRSYFRLAKERKWVIVNSVDYNMSQRSPEDIHEEVWQKVLKVL